MTPYIKTASGKDRKVGDILNTGPLHRGVEKSMWQSVLALKRALATPELFIKTPTCWGSGHQ